MEAVLIVAALLFGAALGAAVCFVVVRATLGKQAEADRIEAGRVLEDAKRDADAARKEADIAAKERMIGLRSEVEQELKERRIEVARGEERADARERDIDQKLRRAEAARAGARRPRGARPPAPGGVEEGEGGRAADAAADRRHDPGRRRATSCSARPRKRRATTWRS